MRELWRRFVVRNRVGGTNAPQPEAKFCCIGFEYFAGEAGKRGFGIFSDDAPDTEAAFVLQFRALDPGGQAHSVPPALLTLVTEIRMIYCPWCAVKLKEFYRSRIEELARPDLKIE